MNSIALAPLNTEPTTEISGWPLRACSSADRNRRESSTMSRESRSLMAGSGHLGINPEPRDTLLQLVGEFLQLLGGFVEFHGAGAVVSRRITDTVDIGRDYFGGLGGFRGVARHIRGSR